MEAVPNESENKKTLEEQPKQKEIRLVDIPVNDENTALNLMVGFLHAAITDCR